MSDTAWHGDIMGNESNTKLFPEPLGKKVKKTGKGLPWWRSG